MNCSFATGTLPQHPLLPNISKDQILHQEINSKYYLIKWIRIIRMQVIIMLILWATVQPNTTGTLPQHLLERSQNLSSKRPLRIIPVVGLPCQYDCFAWIHFKRKSQFTKLSIQYTKAFTRKTTTYHKYVNVKTFLSLIKSPSILYLNVPATTRAFT